MNSEIEVIWQWEGSRKTRWECDKADMERLGYWLTLVPGLPGKDR